MPDPDWLLTARKNGLVVEERPHSVGPARAAPLAAAGMSEAAFTALVIDLARANAWIVAHFRPAQSKSGHWLTAVQGDGAGFPDMVLVRERVIYAELKSARGSLRPEQRLWRDRLTAAGAQWRCWRPCDLEEIGRELK